MDGWNEKYRMSEPRIPAGPRNTNIQQVDGRRTIKDVLCEYAEGDPNGVTRSENRGRRI